MPHLFGQYRKDEGGAIAAMYALALFGLVGIAGVGWDYGRMMAMDSELQNAADQAALAAATQLDGRAGAIARAEAAANDFLATATSDFANLTIMANDGDGDAITDLSYVFYESYNSSTDTFGSVTTDDEDAAVVQVTVNGREVFFALTPIVGLLSSGDIAADAVAGLESATCNVPPLMFCAPNGSNSFPDDGDLGKALRLHMKANQADVWAPGNFGFLDIDYTDTPSGNPNTTLGWSSSFLGCAGEAVESRTGSRTPEMRALNTRFDQYENAPACDPSTDHFCPAQNVRRNQVRVESHNNVQPADVAGLACSAGASGNWVNIEDIDPDVTSPPPSKVGIPTDSCFGSGGCASFGDGIWDAAAYMMANHGVVDTSGVTDLDSNGIITRYEVYRWEIDQGLLGPSQLGYDQELRPNGRYNVDLYCSYPAPVVGTAVAPDTSTKDRRLLTVASVDCSGLSGHAQVDVIRWVDLFLLEPSQTTGSDMSFYGEIAGPAQRPGGGTGFQFFGRNKPVLLR